MTTHYVLTYSGVHYPITREQFGKIVLAAPDDEFEFEGSLIKRKSISDIITKEKYQESFPSKVGGGFQPYSEGGMSWEEIKQLPGSGFSRTITRAGKRLSSLQAFVRGVEKAIAKIGGPCNEAGKFLVIARGRIEEIKNPRPAEVVPTAPPLPEKARPVAVAAVAMPEPEVSELDIEVPF